MGSLMFTPLILLLPTTSVFYTFFTLIYSILSIVRLCLQYLILVLQWFPYAEVALWLLQPKRYPSGIWFQALYAGQDRSANCSVDFMPIIAASRHRDNYRKRRELFENSKHMNGGSGATYVRESEQVQGQTTLVSGLGVETASLGTTI